MPNELSLNWCECKFSDVCDIYTGNSINEQEKASKYTNLDSGYNYIGTKDISFEQTIDYENGVKIPFDNGTFKIAPKNTPLLCIEGGSAGRKLAFTEEEVCFGNKLCAFVSKNKITNLYIFYFLQSTAFRSIFSLNKNGLIGGVSLNKIKSLELYLPPLREQERIVEKIEALFAGIDEGVEHLKSAQAQIKQYRQSVLKSAFEGDNLVRIGDVCDVVRGGSPRPAGSPIYYNGNIPFLKVADLTKDSNKYVYSAEYSIKPAGLTKTRMVKSNTLLLTNSGATLGVPKICTFDTTFNDGIAAFLNMDKQNLLYHYYFWLSKTKELRAINQGAAQPNLNTNIIKDIKIPLPTLSEQQRIVKEIEKRFAVADELEKAVNEGLEKAEKLKQSILKKAFAGKLVPQDPNDEPASLLLERIKKENQSQTKGRKK